MAHAPFLGSCRAPKPPGMMGLMYKPDLTWKNKDDPAYINAMARAKVLHSGKVLHHHTYRGFTGGDVPRGLSKPEVKHVLKQLITQEPDYEGMFEDLPTDMSAFEVFKKIATNYSQPFELGGPSTRTSAPLGGPTRLESSSPLDATQTAPMGGPTRSSASSPLDAPQTATMGGPTLSSASGDAVPTTVEATVRNLDPSFAETGTGTGDAWGDFVTPQSSSGDSIFYPGSADVGAPTPTASPQALNYYYNRLPDIDKEWLTTKGWAGWQDLPNLAKWADVFALRWLYLQDDPTFLTRIRVWALQPSNQSPGYYLQFLRRDKDGNTMATRTYGWGKRGGMSPGYSLYTDRPPVWGRRWRHYKPTYGQTTVAEMNKEFGKIYGTLQEALDAHEERRFRNVARNHKLVQQMRHRPGFRGYGKKKSHKTRKTPRVHRSVKHLAMPKRPFSRLEHMELSQPYHYEELPADLPAIDHLAAVVEEKLRGAARSSKRRRYTGAGQSRNSFVAQRLALPQNSTDMGMSRQTDEQRKAWLMAAKSGQKYTSGAGRRRGGALWIPHKRDPLYTL